MTSAQGEEQLLLRLGASYSLPLIISIDQVSLAQVLFLRQRSSLILVKESGTLQLVPKMLC